jgi:RNA polymerase sigma-70 factor (ECF subfamily)
MTNAPDTAETFVFLLAKHERQVATYVMTLVPNAADADDILQEAKVVMWRHFSEFTPGTNFAAWARKVAFHQVLSHRKRRRRDPVSLSDELLTAIAEESDRAADHLDERQRRLSACMDRLLPEHRRILSLRYGDGLSVEALSARVNRTVAAVYRVLSRIRSHLHECVGHDGPRETLHAEPEPN